MHPILINYCIVEQHFILKYQVTNYYDYFYN